MDLPDGDAGRDDPEPGLRAARSEPVESVCRDVVERERVSDLDKFTLPLQVERGKESPARGEQVEWSLGEDRREGIGVECD